MLEWYDKMVFAGIVLAFIGAMMFIVGLKFAMDARNQAMASYRAAIRQAHEELLKR